jgi:beta-lactamase class A
MRLFGRGKKDEFDEDVDVKDKASKTSRKKVEKEKQPVVWGRAQRLLILGFLLGSVFISLVLALSARKWKLPNAPRIGMPGEINKPVVLKNDDFIDKAYEQEINSFKRELEESVKPLSGIYGVYVTNLVDGKEYGINENVEVQAASLMKLPLMVAFYKKFEAGEVSLSTVYSLREQDKIGGSGSLYYKNAGEEYTYRELLELMGNQSDNTAMGVIRSAVGAEYTQELMNEIGMRDSDFNQNMTTAYDMGVLLKGIYDGSLLTKKSSDEILGFITKTIYEKHMAAGIPTGVRVAHKYGREIHVVNDAGIVYGRKPFVLVLVSDGVVEKEADGHLPQLAKMVWNFENR